VPSNLVDSEYTEVLTQEVLSSIRRLEQRPDLHLATSIKNKNPPQIIGSGYVVKSLEAALWAFFNSNFFKEGALLAVNLGNDADTTGAVYGQIAGAYYGYQRIPEEWKAKLSHRDLIEAYADQLYRLGAD
jgi:ADP-ribosyl-[dinitrogen reductase] hydrolase